MGIRMLLGGRPSEPRRRGSTILRLRLFVVSFIWMTKAAAFAVEPRMEDQFERCCGLGKSWASEGLRCEKFTGPVSGVPRVEQGLCLEAVDICCVRAYREESCEKGKEDARAGLACLSGERAKNSPCPGDRRRDCCEGCKLGILTGSMGQGCVFESFSFGKPWDPAFLDCCREASPPTTTTTTTTTTTSIVATDADTSGAPSYSTDAASNEGNETTTTTSSDPSDYSASPEIPTPALDDICQLMKGLLCSDICVPTPGSFHCECPDDAILLEDGKTCRKNAPRADRCKTNDPCEQRCTDTGSEVICSCDPGFVLSKDERSCSPISSRFGEPEDEDDDDDDEPSPRCPAGYRYNKTAQVCDDTDECEDDPCPPGGVCKNVVGSFVCLSGSIGDREDGEEEVNEAHRPSCPPGYQWDAKVGQCSDIDECLGSKRGACSQDTHLCVNTQGSFACHELSGGGPKACPAGFKFDASARICRDVDECGEGIHGCLPEVEECRNTEGAYECDIKCRKGFAFDRRQGICLDVDECTETRHPCPDPATRCTNTVGAYECEKHEASWRDGEPDAAGSDREGVVVRDRKYTGNAVVENTSPGNCPLGHTFDSGECRGEPIEGTSKKAGFPTISSSSSSAALFAASEPCAPGYKRKPATNDCQDTNECDEGPGCRSHERCENLLGGYDCSPSCENGFQYDSLSGNCRDIDECVRGEDDCPAATHDCVNTNGSYLCEERKNCSKGFRRIDDGSGCVDIDECVQGPGCREFERCNNLRGSYDCSPLCITGWYFDPRTKGCLDVDECLLGRHDCPQASHRCVNTNGSYVCQFEPPCAPGFRKIFNGTCADIDECAENLHDCSLARHRYCVNREGTYECVTRYPECSRGFEYSLTSRSCRDVDECARGDFSCDSKFAERCVNLQGSYRCERPPPTNLGRQSQRAACPSGFRYDSERRECADIDECAEGLDSCGSEVCYNQPGGYSCARAPSPIPPKPRRPPANPANPANPDPILPSGHRCTAGTKYVRNRGCIDIDECQEIEDACTSNERCVNTPASFICECKLGFRRDNLTRACVDINECQLLENDCLPTQRCDNTLGSYNCVRFLPCGTGYTLNAATEICEDDDECLLGTHDCSNGYHCRNTLGSYRCDRNPRISQQGDRASSPLASGKVVATATATATTPLPLPLPQIATGRPRGSCPRGFHLGTNGRCIDIDECQRSPNPCARSSLDKCLNTMGSYRCVSRVLCGNGYALDPSSASHCVDVDECADGSHDCPPGRACSNRQGGYVCECPAGHVAGPNRDCLDVDECSVYAGRHFGSVCGPNGKCENTVGSYRCICEEGFERTETRGGAPAACQDVDECERTPGLCQQNCVNAWGSYRCTCNLGFRLNPDNRSCTDIDECTEFKENNLCIGICDNTPGSYSCSCPNGYKLGVDERTCQDIDECATGRVCRDPNEMCQNTRGSFRCNRIDCPSGYYRDRERKNRCVRTSRYCPSGDLACFRAPSHFSYNFITFVSMLPIPSSGQLELFTMRGTHLPGSTVRFSMALVDARAPPGVVRATESCFALRRPAASQAVLVLTRSIPGPQEIELDLSMEIYHNTAFAGSAVAKLLIFVTQYEF